jgi:hypothetical protein
MVRRPPKVGGRKKFGFMGKGVIWEAIICVRRRREKG